MTVIKKLEERVNMIDGESRGPALTTAEANSVRELWIQLHWTPEEAKEYLACHDRMEGIHIAAGGPYLGSEENREYMILSKRCTELNHDIRGKRVGANRAMSNKVWPEFTPRALRYWQLIDKPRDQLTGAETEEFTTLSEWLDKLRVEAIANAEMQLSKTSVREMKSE